VTSGDNVEAQGPGSHASPADPLRITPKETDRNPTSLLGDPAWTESRHAELKADIIVISHSDPAMLGRRFRMAPESSFEIGRAPKADISLSEVMSVSRQHARLHYRGEVVVLEDLDSTNGTYVNDKVVTGEIELRSGDRFQVGTVHFKFLREQDPEHAYHQAIFQLVTHDGLTEVYNKRKFDEESQRELSRAKRYDRPLSLVLLDIDRFKDVNDRFGHLCGDFVLKRIARLCSGLLRPEQLFARIGGEEFAVLCPETSLEGAGHLAERLRKRIAEEQIEFAGTRVPIQCSFGVAERHPGTKSFDGLFSEADAALYRSKNQGRNRTTLGRPSSRTLPTITPPE